MGAPENPPPASNGVFWAIAAVLFAMSLHLYAAVKAVERHTDAWLCIEAAKANLDTDACERLGLSVPRQTGESA